MKRSFFFRPAMALLVVLAMSLTATPSKASGVLSLDERIARGITSLTPVARHLALAFHAAGLGAFTGISLETLLTTPPGLDALLFPPMVSPPATEPPMPAGPHPSEASDAGHIVPPVPDGSNETSDAGHVTPPAVGGQPATGASSTPSIIIPPDLNLPPLELMDELLPIVTIAGKDGPDDRLLAAYGPHRRGKSKVLN